MITNVKMGFILDKMLVSGFDKNIYTAASESDDIIKSNLLHLFYTILHQKINILYSLIKHSMNQETAERIAQLAKNLKAHHLAGTMEEAYARAKEIVLTAGETNEKSVKEMMKDS